MLISTLELLIAVYIQHHPIIRSHGIGAVLVESEFRNAESSCLGFHLGRGRKLCFGFVMPCEKTRALSLEKTLEKLEIIVETLTEWLAESDVLLQLPPGKSCFPPEQRLVNVFHSPRWGKSSFEVIRVVCWLSHQLWILRPYMKCWIV
jgi:hypothetical protein